jgi:predicted TIM-barrel fold metal-dependent hydrolase
VRREKRTATVATAFAALAVIAALAPGPRARAEALPIFDAHIHYSHDVWDAIPPEGAIAKLRAAGITRALVSSSSDEGTQRLFAAAPDLVLPSLRPYRKRGELQSWLHDESVIPYLEQRLARHRYVAIGEFHVDGADADLPVMRRIVELAREHDLLLHAHADADAIERLFAQDPKARILWAHAGFEDGSRVLELMRKYPTLWADLSFRHEIYLNGRFLPVWRELLTEYSDRFMVGVDTYTPQRWLQINEELVWIREMLSVLPPEAAERIAYKNGEKVIAARFR